MKKVFLFMSALLCATTMLFADCEDGPYALYVNGTSVASFTDAGTSPDNLPQLNAVASLQVGDKVQINNTSCNSLFFPQNIETGGDVDGSGNFTVSSDYATCNVAGCYNFWWKKSFGADRVYIGTDGNCGTTGGGEQGGGNEDGGDCQDGPYALYVNGASAGTFVDGGLAPDGTTPQLNISASLKAGDKIQFNNTSCNQMFFPQEIETGGEVDGSANFTVASDYATCNADGCYNFWWKKIYGGDKLYIGTDGNCGGSTGGGEGGGGSTSVDGLYLIGEWGGKVYGDGDDYATFIEANRFNDCKISMTFTDSENTVCWIRAKAKLNGGSGWMFFSTDDWQGDGLTQIHLYSAKYLYEIGHDALSNRWSVPTNKKLNITLTVVSENEIILTIVDDATFAAHSCGDTPVDPKPEDPKPEDPVVTPDPTTGITVKVQLDASVTDWNENNIYFWVWEDGSEGSWVEATSFGGGWYGFNRDAESVNFVATNANDWGDGLGSLQTEDVTGVTVSSCYKIVAKDGDELNEQKRDLVQTDCPATSDIKQVAAADYRIENGAIITDGELRIFTVTGQDVTALNGRLNGLYIVRIDEKVMKLIVK